MPHVIKCGLVQAKNEVVSPLGGTDTQTINKITKAMLDKHLKHVE
jgi:hypothetical protein